MVRVVCKESGIEFEADSKRTQQHPLVAAIKQDGNKNGTYRQVNEALTKVRKEGGYTTIDEYISRVRAIVDGVPSAKANALAEQYSRDQEFKARQQKREENNATLSANGYRWNKYTDWDTDQDAWALIAPDGRTVTVSQALEEIERGIEIVKAERAAKEETAYIEAQRIEAEAARIKAEEDTLKAQQDAQNQATYAAFDAEVERLVAGMIQVERFDWHAHPRQTIYKMQKIAGGSYYRRHDYIDEATVNGVRCIITVTGSGYDDDGYSTCYCADPVAAGLTIYTPPANPRRSFF